MKKRFKLFVTLTIATISIGKANALNIAENDTTTIATNDTIYEEADISPEFPGGEQALTKYLQDNLKYPKDSIIQDMSIRLLISFVINKKGGTCNINILKHVNPEFDAMAVKVITSMPKWKPAYVNGVPVNYRYTIPVTICIRR